MSHFTLVRVRSALLLAVLGLSALTMLWLLWIFPLATAIAATVVIGLLGLSARLAKSCDGDGIADIGRGESGLHTQ